MSVITPVAETFHIVAGPVPVVEEELYGQIIGKLLNIHKLAYPLVGFGIAGVLGELEPFVPGVARASYLCVSSVAEPVIHLEEIHLFLIISVIGECIVLVVGLAHVDNSFIYTVYIMVDRLV